MKKSTQLKILSVLQSLFMIALIASAIKKNLYCEVAFGAFWIVYTVKAHHIVR